MKKNGVICAINVNDYDQDVVDLAAEMARQFGVDLDLVHVTPFPNPFGTGSPPGLPGSSDALTSDHQRLLKTKSNVQDVKIRFHHLTGFRANAVVGFVDRNEPRVLVLGTHARRGIRRISGSTAMKIMRKVSCPVMVLKQKPNSQTLVANPAGS